MSKLIICNHCQDMFKEEDTTNGELIGFWNENQNFDLCDDCRSKLDEWLHPEENKRLKEWCKKKKEKTGENK